MSKTNSKSTSVKLTGGLELTARLSEAERVAIIARGFKAQRKLDEETAGALQNVLIGGFDLATRMKSEAKGKFSFKEFSTAFAKECAAARESIVSLRGAAKKQWDACAKPGKGKPERAPTRDELKAANRSGELTGEAQAAFRELELTYVVVSKANTIIRQAFEHSAKMAAPLAAFWKGDKLPYNERVSANRLYKIAMRVQVTKGASNDPDAKLDRDDSKGAGKGKGKGASKVESPANVFADAWRRLYALQNREACNALYDLAVKFDLKLRGKDFRKLDKNEFAKANEESGK